MKRTTFTDVTVTIVLPWLVFFLVVSLFLFAFHDMRTIVWVLIGLCCGLSLLFLCLGGASRNGIFLIIGILCLTSVSIGTSMGLWLHEEYLKRYWELDSGIEYMGVDPADLSNRTQDAGVFHFVRETFVDDKRTLGYIADGTIFCVAPVAAHGRGVVPIQYWAVGEDCCEKRSNFDCGTARDLHQRTAIWERPREEYLAAVGQAIAVYGLNESAASAQLVSFVGNPQVVIDDIWDEALTIALVAMILDLCIYIASGLVLARVLSTMSPERQTLLHG